MITLVVGGQSSASAWVAKIASEIVRSHMPSVDADALRREDKAPHLTIEGCEASGFRAQTAREARYAGALFNECGDKLVSYKTVADHVRLLASHLPIGEFRKTPLIKQFAPIFFTHRHPVDQIASYIRTYGLSPERLAALELGKAQEEVIYSAATNCKNFRVLTDDLKRSLLWKRGVLYHIRQGQLDFLDAQDDGLDVHGFRFTDTTIHKEREEVERMARLYTDSLKARQLGISAKVDIGRIFQKMQRSKAHGKAGFHNNKRKVDFGAEFFGEYLSSQLLDYFGDTMVALGYLPRHGYELTKQHTNPVTLAHIGDNPEQEEQTKRMTGRLVEVRDEIQLKYSELEKLPNDNTVLFVDSREGYNAVVSYLSKSGSNAKVHPLYRAQHGYRAPVFDLDARCCLFQDEIVKQSRRVKFLRYADSTRKDTFDPLRESFLERYPNWQAETLKIQRGEEKSLRKLNDCDTVLLCTNNPREVHELARELPSDVRKIAIIPVYAYRSEPLIAAQSGADM